MDILNTNFENLPQDWQKDNADAAEVAVALVEEALMNKSADQNLQISDDFIELSSIRIHEEFLKRRKASGGWIPESQDVAYAELSEADKELDRNQIRLAVQLWREGINREDVESAPSMARSEQFNGFTDAINTYKTSIEGGLSADEQNVTKDSLKIMSERISESQDLSADEKSKLQEKITSLL